MPWLLGWNDIAGEESLKKAFDVALHLGTLVGAVAYFRSDIRRPARAAIVGPQRKDGRLAWLIVLSVVPAAISDALLADTIEENTDQRIGHRASMKCVGHRASMKSGQLAPIGVHARPVEACILELPRGLGMPEKLTAAGITLVRTVSGPVPGLRVGLNRCQYYEGAAFYVAKACVAELHELEPTQRHLHLMEMSVVAAAVFDAFAHDEDAFAHDELVRQRPTYSVGVSTPEGGVRAVAVSPGLCDGWVAAPLDTVMSPRRFRQGANADEQNCGDPVPLHVPRANMQSCSFLGVQPRCPRLR